MAYEVKKKKLAFRVLASILLLSTIGFLFVPSVLITTTRKVVGGESHVTTRYSAASIIEGALCEETEEKMAELYQNGSEGAQVALYMKTEGVELRIADKNTTLCFAILIVFSVMMSVLAGLMNLLSLIKFKKGIAAFLDSTISTLILGAVLFGAIAFALGFFWVSGTYSTGVGADLVRTTVKSRGYLGLLFIFMMPLLSYVFYHDRKVVEEENKEKE